MCSLRFKESEYATLKDEVAFLTQLIKTQVKSLSSYGLARAVIDVLTFDSETRRVICMHPETFFVDTSDDWLTCYSILFTLRDLELTIAQIDYAGQVLKAVARDLNVTHMEDIITDWYDAGMFDDVPTDWRSSMPPPPFIKKTPISLRYERTAMDRVEELLFHNAPIKFIAGYLERFLFQVSLRIHR
ncbi:MAG: hypothetical protein JSR85_06410 [Proteobacteria bacterium]|nr:hypothetical protein [Pseudomonadota bacterium]